MTGELVNKEAKNVLVQEELAREFAAKEAQAVPAQEEMAMSHLVVEVNVKMPVSAGNEKQ